MAGRWIAVGESLFGEVYPGGWSNRGEVTETHFVSFEEAGNIGQADRYFVLLSRFSTKSIYFWLMGCFLAL